MLQEPETRVRYNNIRNRCVLVMRSGRTAQKCRLADKFVQFPKSFYAHQTLITKSESSVGQLKGSVFSIG